MGETRLENGNEETKTPPKSIGLRLLTAFWILGLCNNYGYVVMLSAAHDILGDRFNDHDGATNETMVKNETIRDCNEMSTGAILLADIMPSLFIKITAPFFPLVIHFRMGIILILSALGFILVGVAQVEWLAIVGVICTSLSSGLGEASLLSYMAFYKNKNVITTWSSGTGAAGFVGAMSYLVLSKFLPLDVTVYLLVIVPVIMGLCFWLLLVHPDLSGNPQENVNNTRRTSNPEDDVPVATTQDTFKEKLVVVPSLLKYMIPLGLVYLFEYFINQGLFELIEFDVDWMTHGVQYKTYQVLYQIGVFISRSSINLVTIKKTWLLAVLQGINVIIFGTEAVYSYLPSIYLAFLFVFWEGFLGGAAYVNTYHRINNEVLPEKREFSMAVTSLADALGISLAGFLSLPTHNYICGLPKYN